MLPPQAVLTESVTSSDRYDSVFSIPPYLSDVLMAGTATHQAHAYGAECQEPTLNKRWDVRIGVVWRDNKVSSQSKQQGIQVLQFGLFRYRFPKTVGEEVFAFGVHTGMVLESKIAGRVMVGVTSPLHSRAFSGRTSQPGQMRAHKERTQFFRDELRWSAQPQFRLNPDPRWDMVKNRSTPSTKPPLPPFFPCRKPPCFLSPACTFSHSSD